MPFPLNAVRWLTPPRDIAAMVTGASADNLTAELFHFGTQSRAMAAELYLLSAGSCRAQFVEKATGRAAMPATRLTVDSPRTRLELELPPAKLCVLRVERERAAPPPE